MRTIWLIILVLIWTQPVTARRCPSHGVAASPAERRLNIAKNRSAKPPRNQKPQILPLNHLINPARREDSNRYTPGAYVQTTGYLVSYEEQGPETCNCNLSSTEKKDGDVHIYLGLTPNAKKKNCIVVEITPSYKKLHPDYESSLSRGARVSVSGYLFYDTPHRNAAANTCKHCAHIWRKTCWEIHPVTGITPL
jgi:hypothetical protein